ncbi:uncharacterized protein LOC130498828 [Raphanus sativus]|uniref:Uncharacterized protein LOC130498828 n=1 Tax=Raphanus sativus TaxID=3726 RepID=A0A9W3CA21_RAPSA|nr:uncharacterized protein LOC130498828 [Raphanus sativus]
MSWQGRRGKGKGAMTIRCRLDRALANEDWHTLFPVSFTEYLGMVGSDHRPVVAFLDDKIQRTKGQFRFDKRWIGQEGLMESITTGWRETGGEDTVDIVTKISNCRHEVAKWRKNNPPYGKDKIADLQKALEEVQTDDNRSQEEILEISKKLQDAYKDEEEYWQQKSRNTWNTAGDRSTKFYHALTKQRRARNRIVGLYDEGGNWITEEQGIEKVAVNYFEDLFTTTSPSEFEVFLGEITPSITHQTNQMLIKLATEEEVRQALFMMHPEKAPGPDGMTALFFQHSWHIIKKDLVEMRLKLCLPTLISETQSAFVAGRLISDNILIAQEMFHGLRTNKACQGKFMAIKTDMSKAYDRVEWDFIQALLNRMGFDSHWTKLMMGCISSVQYQAQKEECQTILRILKEYEAVSGQQINFQKSSIQFGHKIEEASRQELRDILGIQNLGGMGSYLGLPENIGGSKVQVFGFIQERLNSRVNGWIFKFFTKGGKEVIIKSVITALPNHVMSCFRLPKTTTKKLTSAVAQFWWSPGGSTKGMHWKSWDKLVLSKEEGGLGFKELTDFNTAMLGKQLWRLIEKPNTLFSRVFKGRYFRNASPLEPIRSYSSSYGWRSITSARSLVSKGLIKRVGTGSSISVWNDPWIPSTRPRPANKNLHITYPDLTVDSLIDSTSRTWNSQALRTLVDPQDVKIIESIPLSKVHLRDRDGWHFTNNGKYTVKSGYQVERVYPDKERSLPVLGPTVDILKAYCWKVKCPPKMKHFLWQLVSGCIAVKKNLQARGLKGDICCDRCGAPEETINHVFFECPPARQVWALSRIPSSPAIFPYQSLFTNLDYLFWRIDPKVECHQFPWILWYIWKARNLKVFSNLDVDPRDTLKLADTESALWNDAQMENAQVQVRQVDDNNPGPRIGRWCFIDGSWKDKDISSGQGWYSTLEGFDSLMGARNVRASLSPLHSEVEALIWAMECMRNLRQFRADRLARSARMQPSFVVHMDSELPAWIIESR